MDSPTEAEPVLAGPGGPVAADGDDNASETGASTDTGLFSVNPDVVNSFPEVETHLHAAAAGLSAAFVDLVKGECRGGSTVIILCVFATGFRIR